MGRRRWEAFRDFEAALALVFEVPELGAGNSLYR